MRARSMLLALLISAIFASTHQAQNPNCQPTSSSKTFEKTLFVFLVESDPVNGAMKYIMKQMACAIPESANLKTYILDYSDETVVLANTENDFSSSQQLLGKIDSSLTGTLTPMDGCERLKQVHKKFIQQSVVQGYKVKYIGIYMTRVCALVDVAANCLNLLIKHDQVSHEYWLTRNTRADLFILAETEAPPFLKEGSTQSVAALLGDTSMVQTAASATSSDSSDKSESCLIAYGLAGGIAVVLGVVVVVLTVLLVKGKKGAKNSKDKKDKKGKKGNKNKKGEVTTPSTEITNEEEKSRDEKDKDPPAPSILQNP